MYVLADMKYSFFWNSWLCSTFPIFLSLWRKNPLYVYNWQGQHKDKSRLLLDWQNFFYNHETMTWQKYRYAYLTHHLCVDFLDAFEWTVNTFDGKMVKKVTCTISKIFFKTYCVNGGIFSLHLKGHCMYWKVLAKYWLPFWVLRILLFEKFSLNK